MSGRSHRRPDGFTLLEILVALVVFGFLLAGLAQGMQLGLRVWDKGVGVAGADDDLMTLDATLRRLVEGLDPGDDLDPAPMTGSKDRLDCLTTLSSADGPLPGRRMRAVLFVGPDHRLVLRWRQAPRAILIGAAPPLAETELLSGVAGIELAYMRSGGSWLNAWRSPDLPALVRIRVKFLRSDPRVWPEIVAAPLRDRP
jgi:general secretion pathway protein J